MINHSKAIFSLLAPMFPNWSISLFDLFSPLPCAESVRDAVGRKVKLSLRKRVKLEIKGDKTENRVLVSQFLLPLSRYFFIRSNAVAVCLYISHLKFSVLMKEHQNPPCFIPSSALEWPALFPGEHHFSALWLCPLQVHAFIFSFLFCGSKVETVWEKINGSFSYHLLSLVSLRTVRVGSGETGRAALL